MKTPIQELIEELTKRFIPYNNRELYYILEKYGEKEKQFAFDCFEAGESYCSYHCGPNLEESPDFEQFYSQYAEQHTK